MLDARTATAQAHSVQNLYSLSGGRLDLNLHPGQSEAWDSEARFTFIYAGTQSGKTSFLPWWQWREIMRTLRPGEPNDFIAATATYDLFKLKLLPVMRLVWEDVFKMGRYWSGPQVMELCDDTGKFWANRADDAMYGRIILRSASSRGGLESLTGKNAILDECGMDEFELAAWEAVLRRLSLYQGRVLGGTTLYNLGWTYHEVYQRWRDGDPDFKVVQFDSTTNPSFPQAEYERAKRTMSDDKFKMFYQGQFARPAGLIYDCVDEDSYVDAFPIPKHWPIYTGVDFGSENTATVWIAEDPDRDKFYLFHETLEGGKTTREHCVKARMQANGYSQWYIYGGSGSEEQQRMDWSEEGVHVQRPLIPEVEAGILRVYSILKPRKLRIFNTCVGIRDELGSYRRVLDYRGDPTEQIVDKRKYHRLDALRYVTSGMTGGRATVGGEIW